MNQNPIVLAIVGPTASGKTPLSLSLARQLNAEIISADSRQIYRSLNIGTAKPTSEELSSIKHHFIDILDPDEEYSAGQFGIDARAKITELLSFGKTPLIVGGSGLYLRAIIDGFFEGPGRDDEVRKELEERLEREGRESMYQSLLKADPDSALRADPSKVRRIIRALEVLKLTGKPMSVAQKELSSNVGYEVLQIGLEWPRSSLYDRINKRVDRMMESGLLEEVKSLLMQGYDLRCNSLNTVGYREIIDALASGHSIDEAVELIKRNTRQYAKRQLTWFRADKRIEWMPIEGDMDIDQIAKIVLERFESRKRTD